MLFKTIYGPELESIFNFISKHGPVKRELLYRAYLPVVQGSLGNKTNLDDAITFLISSNLVQKDISETLQVKAKGEKFKLLLLTNLRQIQEERSEAKSIMDAWFLNLLEILFIKPNQLVLFKLHQRFNDCGAPEIISEEKVNAWRRFMEYMGAGRRVFSGFYSLYSPGLLLELIKSWPEKEGPIQLFFEEQMGKYIPWQTSEGDAASAVTTGLTYLENNKLLTLTPRQDLPYRSYLGSRKIKWIRKESVNK